ncbi:MAG: hypothetical protein EOP82_23405 [Variovorax sp.]|nr:MAG: hypothetical protein EOP82_23405 [Variovorax sp.]
MQEAQVWEAADVLLQEGLRPTIERVRQKIGSGSPNTVSPTLERWFATLGKRLEGRGTSLAEDGAAAAAAGHRPGCPAVLGCRPARGRPGSGPEDRSHAARIRAGARRPGPKGSRSAATRDFLRVGPRRAR